MKKISKKFLVIFSLCSVSAAGIVWACGGEDYDDSMYSSFSPEAFVAPAYTPFFYESSTTYYGDNNEDRNNTRYNDVVLKDWDDYLGQQIDKQQLKKLLFSTSYNGVDSVYNYYRGKHNVLAASLPAIKPGSLKKQQADAFFSYLLLAKKSEDFAVNTRNYWEDKPAPVSPSVKLGTELNKAFESTNDSFIKQRLWFQLLRYSYFQELEAGPNAKPVNDELVTLFDKYSTSFPKNSIYYRALGYVAGHYYKKADFAKANYLYSLCYDYSNEMKIPSKWSFRPQNEADWNKSLALAQNNEQKITLWQMLGVSSDENRAIEKIYALNPKSDKLELLLSRLINKIEMPSYNDSGMIAQTHSKNLTQGTLLVTRIAAANNTSKPYFWNLAAGYLNSLKGNYTVSKSFYTKAKTQLPKNNKLILAQYKLLDWALYLSQLKTIDAAAERKMVEHVNWMANLRDGKDTINNLRFSYAVSQTAQTLSKLYAKQGDAVKAVCFQTDAKFYLNNQNIEALKSLLGKASKTPFEQAMLRYYPHKIEDLYYHQGLMLVYQDKLDEAIVLMEKSGKKAQIELLGNPFNIRINDCHDCDFAMIQKKKYTPLSLVKTMKGIKDEVAAGKNVYANNWLLANAYYNITHYGNARYFYETPIIMGEYSAVGAYKEFIEPVTSAKLAEKYYLLARTAAKTKEQKARCTFMASKCERNEIYNVAAEPKNKNKVYDWQYPFKKPPVGKYFAELKNNYSNTQYYKEILQECGYFKTYLTM